jgi:hypothetical protein
MIRNYVVRKNFMTLNQARIHNLQHVHTFTYKHSLTIYATHCDTFFPRTQVQCRTHHLNMLKSTKIIFFSTVLHFEEEEKGTNECCQVLSCMPLPAPKYLIMSYQGWRTNSGVRSQRHKTRNRIASIRNVYVCDLLVHLLHLFLHVFEIADGIRYSLGSHGDG